ncbi:MAG: SAM-dependent chlorinase/fluorinase [Ectothiorhodospiraceae bacterium]|nr:SAM-dependent chlorinase/fluorinase [Ectothiorhodospiraceae bacterium]
MFALFTDFGYRGPYVGQLKAVLAARKPDLPVVDLCHEAPRFDPRNSSYLLAAFSGPLAVGTVVIAVVDPGVGSDRPAWVLEADGRYFVGPDNGLMEMVVRRARETRAWRLPPAPPEASPTFHGRDVFAGSAVSVAEGALDAFLPMTVEDRLTVDWADDTPLILFIDDYGNAMTGIRGELLSDRAILQVGDYKLRHAETFSRMPRGTAFWFRNSSGLVELAVNGGAAVTVLGLEGGGQVRLLAP